MAILLIKRMKYNNRKGNQKRVNMKKTIFKNLIYKGENVDIVSVGGKIEKIGKVSEDGIDFGGLRVYPGLVDIHSHGMGGVDTMDCDLEPLARYMAENGTTTFYPTAMTGSPEALERVLNSKIPVGYSKIPGFHMEGPFINKKYCGAQNCEFIRKPTDEFYGKENIKIVTVAPEIDGAMEFIEKIDAVVSVGHSSADYDCVKMASQKGVRCVTHILNAMAPFHHREPSIMGAAYDCNMYIQVICDGEHIHPSVIRVLYNLFGAERMILISDSMRATLLKDGEYDLGGLEIDVKNKIARTKDGALAGSTATLYNCVMKAIEFGIDIEDAFKMASETPARLMGINCGRIEEGYDCDLLVLNDDNSINKVIIDGEIKNQE